MPKKVDEYYKQVKEQNPSYSEEQAWATAWSIYCKHKNPGSPSCKKDQSEYFPGKKKAQEKEAMNSATVEAFLLVLSGRLTRADEAARKRDKGRGRWNMYQLGHQFKAVENIKADMAGYLKRDDPEALEALKKSICRRFTCSRQGRPDLLGARQTVVMIDKFLNEGKMPKYSSESSDHQLRNKLIRLAHEKPELRSKLLPLLKEAGTVSVGDRFRDSWGVVWVVSEPDRGGTVHVYPESRGERFSQPENVSALRKFYTRLAKEESPADMAAKALEGAGYKVKVTGPSAVAIKAVAGPKPDKAIKALLAAGFKHKVPGFGLLSPFLMDGKEIKLKVASTKSAALQDGPLGRVLDNYWNTLHDMEQDLENVASKYDMAGSYGGGPGQREAKYLMDAINRVKADLEKISMRQLGKLAKLESDFIKKFGDPDDYVEGQRDSLFR